MPDLPSGTVTFLFTDIEGSTTLAQQFPAELPALLARHHAVLHQAIRRTTATSFKSPVMPFARHSIPPAMRSTPRSTRSAACSRKPGILLRSKFGWASIRVQRRPEQSKNGRADTSAT